MVHDGRFISVYRFRSLTICAGLTALLCGCSQSSPPASPRDTATSADSSATSTADKEAAAKVKTGQEEFWADFPDVPKIEVMTEVDGIKIPRMPIGKDSLNLTGKLPADVGNEHAAKKPSEPVTGDTLIVRFAAEPKVLNTLTESSAYMTYIMQYVNDYLARRNQETFEWEPAIASKWILEDSVKLSADFPGRERRVSMNDSPPQPTLDLNHVVPAPTGDKSAEPRAYAIKVSDKEGKPLARVWVGVFPTERIVGASTTGYHFWSNDSGIAEVGGFPAGKYVIKVGDEIYGLSDTQQDGTLLVKPGTPENPLREPMTIKAGDWQDIQLKTYGTFYLREDAKWSDGAPYTSRDVEFGYALLNNKFVDCDAIRTYYSDLIECTAFGAHTVRLKFRQQYFLASEYFYQLGYVTPPFHFFQKIHQELGRELTLDRLTPAEEAQKKQISAHGQEFGKFFNTDERYNSKPLGNGPYIIDKWERKDRVELVRNPNYWNPAKAGHLDRIIIRFIPDQVTALTALRAGEIDFFYSMQPSQYFEDWPTLDKETQDNFVKSEWFAPRFSYVGWNELMVQLKDRRVRLALTMLFDRQQFIDTKMHGAAVRVSGTQYIFGPMYDREVAPVAYDPDTARDLLSSAGWIDSDNDGVLDKDGKKLEIELRIPNGSPMTNQIAEVMQKNFKSVGIELKILTMEWASFVEKMRAKECDATMLSWVMDPESDPYQIWHSSGAARENRGSNYVSFNNKRADELIEMIRVTLDPAKRARVNQSFHRLIDSEQPYSFLWTPKELGAYHKRFRNVKWYRLRPGFDLSEWYVPKDEQRHKSQ